jgi:hypothetical protein
LPAGKDVTHHRIWTQFFVSQFWAGDVYPRWISDLNSGLGSPTFFVYSPVFYFIAALLQPIVFGVRSLFELDAALALGLFTSGLAAYVWFADVVSNKAAILASIAYMAMPYHLWGDFYVRCSVSEVWAFVWMPLILHFASSEPFGGKRAVAGVAVCFALLVSSHLITALLFVPVAALYVFWMAPQRRRLRATAAILVALLLGFGISAWYFLPAMAHERHISAARLAEEPHYWYQNSFLVTDFSLFVWNPLKNGFNWYATWMAVHLGFLAVAASLLVWDCSRIRRAELVFWITLVAALLWIMSPCSAVVWKLISPLQQIQFPWRFHAILTLAGGWLVAVAADAWMARPKPQRRLIVLSLSAVLLTSLLPYGHVWRLYTKQTIAQDQQAELRAGADYLRRVWARWTAPELLRAEKIGDLGVSLPKAKVLGGAGDVTVERWRPRDISLHVRLSEPSDIQVHQFYYPGWTARMATGDGELVVTPSYPEGLIRVRAPAGDYEILIAFPMGPSEQAGLIVSILSLALTAGIWFSGRRRVVSSVGLPSTN